MDSGLDFYRRHKLGCEQVLERGVQRRRQTDTERQENPTPDGYVEIPMADDIRAKFEYALRLFTQVVENIERSESE